MDRVTEIDLRVAGRDIARAIAEICFVTVHAEMVGPHRQDAATQTFSETLLRYVQIVEGIRR